MSVAAPRTGVQVRAIGRPARRPVPTSGTAPAGRPTVLKIGGSLADTGGAARVFDAAAAAFRGGEPLVLVHGGGRELSDWLDRLGIVSRFLDGQRVTGPEALTVALAILGGLVNRRTVEELARRGCPAIGLTGADGGGMTAAPLGDAALGAVGRIVAVDAAFYLGLIAGGRLPVLASVAWNREHGWLNVNADLMAGALAAGLGARRLLLTTDVPGVLDRSGEAYARLRLRDLRRLIARGEVRDGMVPKSEACRIALRAGVPEVRILGPEDPIDGAGGTRVVAA